MAIVHTTTINEPFNCVAALSPDGRYVVGCKSLYHMMICDVETGACVDTLLPSSMRNIVPLHHDSRGCWVGSTIAFANRRGLLVLRVNSVAKIQSYAWRGFNHLVDNPRISPCEQHVCVDRHVRRRGQKDLQCEETLIFDVAISNRKLSIARHYICIPNFVFATWSPDAKTLAGCMTSQPHAVVLFDTTTDKWWLNSPSAQWMPIDAKTMESRRMLYQPFIKSISWSPNGAWLALRLRDTMGSFLIAITTPQGHLQRLYDKTHYLGWLDGRRFLTYTVDRSIRTGNMHDVMALNDVNDVVTPFLIHYYDLSVCLTSKVVTVRTRFKNTCVIVHVFAQKWMPRLHVHFSYNFRQRVLAVLCCNMRSVPPELLFEMFDTMLRR